ncbi:MAG: glycoside hydrolase family 26 protein [Acidimicrobiia bacterium]
MTSGKRGILLALIALLATLSGGSQPAGAEPGVAVATDRILAGVYAPQQWFSADHILALNAASGKNVSIGGLWFDVDEPPANVHYMLDEIWSAGATPFVNIHVAVTAAEVAAGAVDDHISAMASAVDAWLAKGGGRSVMLAPMPEMNGDWIPYGMTPTDFIAAYRHFVSVASQSGATFWRVRWVFAPNGWSAPPYHMADYYPGADVVDLVGMSAYNWGSAQVGAYWTTVEQTMGGALDEARGFAPEKPFLVSQTASSPFGGDKDAWIRDLFAYLADDPNAVGFIYFNIEKEHDWSMFKGGLVAPGWRDGMNFETTVYQWPLDDWFQPGMLTVDTYLTPFDGTFSDDDSSAFEKDIEWLYSSGITTGCAATLYCPASPVMRGQMATFLSRARGLPPPTADYFADDAGSPYESSDNQVKEAGISNGCSATAFCPNAPTTREQMASFLVRALQLPASTFDYFGDDEGSIHEADINALAQAGITSGCTATTYCPGASVTREQMAAFLHRALAPT